MAKTTKLRVVKRFSTPVPPIKRTPVIEVRELSEETKAKLVVTHVDNAKLWGKK